MHKAPKKIIDIFNGFERESKEELWNSETEMIKYYQKDENTICLSVLGRALKKLHSKSGEYYKINVDMVKQKTIEILDKKEIFTFTF